MGTIRGIMARGILGVVLLSLLGGLNAGCSASPVGMAMHAVGDVVDDVDVKDRAKQLVGEPPARADEMFGEPIDRLRDVNSSREWVVYRVAMDPLGTSHYVVEAVNGQIVAVSKTKEFDNIALDAAEMLADSRKVMGKPPAECEQCLGMGDPLLTVRRERDGQLVQLYDASVIEIPGITKPHYCVLRFDGADRCRKLALVTVEASTTHDPTVG